VLVKNQTAAAENGIYVAAAGTWSRSSDANTWDELVSAFVFVEGGTTNDDSGWVCSISPGGTLGVTAVTWVQFSGAGQITAGAGLTKTGNTLNVGTASASRIVVNADDIDLATTGVAANTYKSVTVDAYGRVTGGTNPTTLAGYGISDAYTIAQVDSIFGSTTSAAASAAAAASSASAASTSASNALTSENNALSSANAAAASFDSFDDRYLGAKASDPTVDNDGNPLITGALYFNTAANEMRVYSGSAWLASYLPATTYVQGPASATDNAIARYDGTTGKVIQNSGAVIDDSGNVGVGVTPSAWVSYQKGIDFGGAGNYGSITARAAWTEVANNAYINGSAVDIYKNSSTAGKYAISGNAHVWYTAPTGTAGNTITYTQAMTLNANGSLLVGGVNELFPTANRGIVEVQGSSQAIYGMGVGGTAAGYILHDGTNMDVWQSRNGYLRFATNSAERMRIDSSGNVGIGTASPNSRFMVTVTSGENARFTNTTGTERIHFAARSSAGVAKISSENSDLQVYATDANALLLGTSNTERMRIDSSGNVGIGTTPTCKLDVLVGSNQRLLMRERGSGAVCLDAALGNNTAYQSLFVNGSSIALQQNATTRVTVNAGLSVGTAADPGAGGIYATGNITAYYSDARLKDFKGTITNALDKVSKLNGYVYVENETAKKYGYDSDAEQVGVSAQEVEAVLPHVVTAAPFDLTVDESGNKVSKSGEHYKTVRYERLVPLLIEAIKELKAEVEALKAAK
jgi:hypothetical protein